MTTVGSIVVMVIFLDIGAFFFVTQCHSIVKSIGCYQRRLFVCVFVCHMITFERVNMRWCTWGVGSLCKYMGRVRILGVIVPLVCTTKYGVGLRRWENQHRLSSFGHDFLWWWACFTSVTTTAFIALKLLFWCPIPSSRQHLSRGDCLEDKKEDDQNCSVL